MLPKRQSRQQLQLSNYNTFTHWLDTENIRQNQFVETAKCLKSFLLSALDVNSNLTGRTHSRDPSSAQLAHAWASSIRDVLQNCDNNEIYDRPEVVLAYAHIHFLERYHRFWDVLLILLRVGVLPLPKKQLDVLDIGTGPGPTLYAVQDFYSALHRYAQHHAVEGFRVPFLNLQFVERSKVMSNFIHHFSEFCLRPGPYHVTFQDFRNLNLQDKRMKILEREVSQVAEEFEMSSNWAKRWLMENDLQFRNKARNLFRYNFAIMSNFLTSVEQVQELEEEIGSLFRNLRNGGVAVVLGGTAQQYPMVYEQLLELATEAGLHEIHGIPQRIPRAYGEYHTNWMKHISNSMWEAFGHVIDVRPYEEELSDEPAIWDPGIDIHGRQSFAIRVYRRGA